MFTGIKQRMEIGTLEARVAIDEQLDAYKEKRLTREAYKELKREAREARKAELIAERDARIRELKERLAIEEDELEDSDD